MASGPQPRTPGQHWGAKPPGAPQQRGTVPRIGLESPVPMVAARVTPRRVGQYILDDILAGLVPGLVFWLIDNGNTGLLHALAWVVAVTIWVLIMVWYWVARPFGHGGQTFGMQLLGLRIISKDGDRAGRTQLLVRWILLIIDSLFLGLVGLITMLCSRYRQRVGDHAAGTLVVDAAWRAEPARR